MPNWHITFDISGKRLDKALDMVHSLRPDNLGVQPIKDGSPTTKSGQPRGAMRDMIRKAIAANGQKPFKVNDIVAQLNGLLKPAQVRSHLEGLSKQKELVKLSGARWKAVKHG